MTPEEIGDELPVPCVCGNRPTVCWIGSPLAYAWYVACALCKRECGCYTTRERALKGWAERVYEELGEPIR